MRKPQINGSVAIAAALTASFFLPAATAWAQNVVVKGADGGSVLFVDGQQADQDNNEVVIGTLEGAPAENKYWVGVSLLPLDEVARAQLDLPEDVGIVVGKVFPDSPAAEDGIERLDVIVRLGDEPIHEPAQMAKIVRDAKGSKLTFKVLRKGKPIELTVTPTERPASEEFTERRRSDDPLSRWPEGFIQRPREYRVVRPGIVLARPSGKVEPLPEGMRLRIDREGNKPAQITVDRGDEHWEVSEDELDKLPADVRKHVEQYLGRAGAGDQFTWQAPIQQGLRWLLSEDETEKPEDKNRGDKGSDNHVWQELDEGGPLPPDFNVDRLTDQIETMRKQLNQLTDEQAKRTEDLVEKKSEELEKTLNERVTDLENMLTKQADQLRAMIESVFGDGANAKIKTEVGPGGDAAEKPKTETEKEEKAKDSETKEKEDVKTESNPDTSNSAV